ncbi:YegP family protein [Microbacterium sp. As-52]|uniref:YegP family protein n=1 Tax=Microbacterium sp. As-52 TaxID=3390503 RepID=UPI003CF8DF0A
MRREGRGSLHPREKGRLLAGKFELYTDKSGEYRFRLKAGNGEVIAISEGYSSKSAALNGIDSVRRNAADAEVVEAD